MSLSPSYPIQLRMAGRPVLVAGAGRVAARKIERLVQSGAEVHVVAHEASAPVRRLAQQGKLRLSLRAVEAADAQHKFLVIAATDDPEANATLSRAARGYGVLVSRVDAPEDSDFIVPALASGSHVEATVSTGGAAPSASRRLGRELARWIEAGPDRFARELSQVRLSLRGRPDASLRMRRLAEGELFEACARADEARIQSLVSLALTPDAASDADCRSAPSGARAKTGGES